MAAGHSGRLCGIVGTSAALGQLPAPRQRVGLGWWVELACPPIGPRLPKVGHGRANCLRGFARPCLCRCARPCAPALASIGLCCLGLERDLRVGPRLACTKMGLVAVWLPALEPGPWGRRRPTFRARVSTRSTQPRVHRLRRSQLKMASQVGANRTSRTRKSNRYWHSG